MNPEQFKRLLGSDGDAQARPSLDEINAYIDGTMDRESRAEFEVYLSFNEDFRREVVDLVEQARLEGVELAQGQYEQKTEPVVPTRSGFRWPMLLGFGTTAAACVLIGLYLGRSATAPDQTATDSLARRESALDAEEKRLEDERQRLDALQKELEKKPDTEAPKPIENEYNAEQEASNQKPTGSVQRVPRSDNGSGSRPDGNNGGAPAVRPSDLLALAAQLTPINPVWIAGSTRGGFGFGPWGAQRSDTISLDWKPETWMASARVKIQDAETRKAIGNEIRLDRDATQSGRLTLGKDALPEGKWHVITLTVEPDEDASQGPIRTASIVSRRLSASEREALVKEEGRLGHTFADNPVVFARTLSRLRSSFGLVAELSTTLESAYPGLADDSSSQREYHRELGELLEGMGFTQLALKEYLLARRLGDDSRSVEEAIKRCEGAPGEAIGDGPAQKIEETKK